MKSIRTSHRLLHRVTWLLCAGIFAIALPANAKDKDKHRHHSTHHYNSHYPGHSTGHSSHHSTHRNFDRYEPRYGYYDGYYDDYPAYSPRYRGRSYYEHSNYGHSHHNSLAESLLLQFLNR